MRFFFKAYAHLKCVHMITRFFLTLISVKIKVQRGNAQLGGKIESVVYLLALL